MTFFFRCKDRNLRMEDSSGDRYWLYLIVLTDTVRSLLAQACTNALNVGKNKRFTSTTADKGIKNDGLEERKTERIRCENGAMPRIRRYQIKRIYASISGQYRFRTHNRHFGDFSLRVVSSRRILISG